MLRDCRTEPVRIEVVVPRELVGGPRNESEFVSGDGEGVEDGSDDVFIVLRAERDKIERGLEVIKEGVHVGDEDGHFDACAKEIGDLGQRDEVSDMCYVSLQQNSDKLGSKCAYVVQWVRFLLEVQPGRQRDTEQQTHPSST